MGNIKLLKGFFKESSKKKKSKMEITGYLKELMGELKKLIDYTNEHSNSNVKEAFKLLSDEIMKLLSIKCDLILNSDDPEVIITTFCDCFNGMKMLQDHVLYSVIGAKATDGVKADTSFIKGLVVRHKDLQISLDKVSRFKSDLNNFNKTLNPKKCLSTPEDFKKIFNKNF